MDWLDLLAVQGILKSLLQYRSSKASIQKHQFVKMVSIIMSFKYIVFLLSCFPFISTSPPWNCLSLSESLSLNQYMGLVYL